MNVRLCLALVVPPLVWYVQEQALAGPLRIDCHVADGWPAIAWGVVSLVCCAVAAALGWSQVRGEGLSAWLARLAIAGAAVFSVAIAFGALAAALVPACAR
jgi:hypothetical protein